MRRKVAEMSGEEFGETLRREFGWGFQRIFSEAVGVNESTISRWVKGDINLPLYAEVLLELLLTCKNNNVPLPDRFSDE